MEISHDGHLESMPIVGYLILFSIVMLLVLILFDYRVAAGCRSVAAMQAPVLNAELISARMTGFHLPRKPKPKMSVYIQLILYIYSQILYNSLIMVWA